MLSNVGFHKWGAPKWMVYNGKSIYKWMRTGVPILGNFHMLPGRRPGGSVGGHGCVAKRRRAGRAAACCQRAAEVVLRDTPCSRETQAPGGTGLRWGQNELRRWSVLKWGSEYPEHPNCSDFMGEIMIHHEFTTKGSTKLPEFSACCASYFSFCLGWLGMCLIWSV